MHQSTSDLLDMIAVSCGITKFVLQVSKSCSFSARVYDRHLCESKQPSTTAIQWYKALNYDTLGQGIYNHRVFVSSASGWGFSHCKPTWLQLLWGTCKCVLGFSWTSHYQKLVAALLECFKIFYIL